MPQHSKKLLQERAAKLRELGKKAEEAFLSNSIGKRANIIVEQGVRGRTEHFAPVLLNQKAPEGALLDVEIIDKERDFLKGENSNKTYGRKAGSADCARA